MSSAAAVSAAQCWRRQRDGSIGRVAEAARQQRGDGGQCGGGFGSGRMVAAAVATVAETQRQWAVGRQGSGGGSGGIAAAVAAEGQRRWASTAVALAARWPQRGGGGGF